MSQLAERLVPELPQKIKKVLDEFLASAQKGLVTDLTSAVLFGSAAEGRLRATSDVNLLLVMSRFQQENIDLLREPLRFAAAAIQLRVMFLLEDEVAAASVAFALKFADLQHRHVVLFGTDPFAQLQIPRTAEVFRLQQVLLNLVLRLREAYVSRSQREEQLAIVIAEAAGPLRTSAATLLRLETGTNQAALREALIQVAQELGGNDNAFSAQLQALSTARETRALPHGVAGPALIGLIQLAARMRLRAEKLTLENTR